MRFLIALFQIYNILINFLTIIHSLLLSSLTWHSYWMYGIWITIFEQTKQFHFYIYIWIYKIYILFIKLVIEEYVNYIYLVNLFTNEFGSKNAHMYFHWNFMLRIIYFTYSKISVVIVYKIYKFIIYCS